MSRRIIIFDLALVAFIAFGIVRLRSDWMAFDPVHDVSAVQALPETLPALPAPGAVAVSGTGDWTEVSSRNPFSFDRTDIAILAPVVAPPAQTVGPKPVLFGVMSVGAGPLALLAPAQAASRGSQPTKVGETVAGWQVVEILEKSIVVEANGIRETVLMNDPTAAPPRSHAVTAQASTASTVTKVGGSQPAAPARSADSSAPAGTTAEPGAQPAFREIRTPFGVWRQPIVQ